jgi:hypothetical protein
MLVERIGDLELLKIHSNEKIRQEAGLAKQKDAAKKANSEPPLNDLTEGDNENPPKRSRVMLSNKPLELKLNVSKPTLSLFPTIRPQAVASNYADATCTGKKLESSQKPSSRIRMTTPEPTMKEAVKEDKSPKRSLTKKFSDKLLRKKFEAAPPVPQKDHQPSKPLPAPPNDPDIEGDGAAKRLTVATMDSGYQSFGATSVRNSVDSID